MGKKNRQQGKVLNLRDLQSIPAALANSEALVPDPARDWRGAPPQFGVIKPTHISTVAGWVGSQARVYPAEDEAQLDSVQNCERMRRDPVIMECLKARQRAVALLPWHLVPEDENDPVQKQLVADLTTILERTYRFTELRRYLMEAIWYGKSFVQLKYWPKPVGGQWRQIAAGWEPRHSDKILFRYSDGTHAYVAGQVGIRIAHHAKDVDRNRIEPTQYGLAYFLKDYERRLCIVHKHEIEDGPFLDVLATGRIHGVGIRDTVYWTWYASKEVEQKLLEYLDRTALGIEIWRYPSGNAKAEADARKAATERIGGGRSIVLVPVIPGEQADLFGVQHIEPGPAGAELLQTICHDFYGRRIKRLILGQTLTTEAEATGLGSGVADAHMATFSDVIRYDAVNLQETLTEDFVNVIKEINFPWARGIYIRLVLNTERPEVEQKLGAYQAAWNMGLKVRAEDIYALIGARRPDDEDDVLQNPTMIQLEQQSAMMAMQQQAGGAGGPSTFGPMGEAGQDGGGPVGEATAGPPGQAPGEVERDAAGEPVAVPANPWAGFWDSLFAAARGHGITPPAPPVEKTPGIAVPAEPRVDRAELARVFQDRFDEAIRVRQQTAAEFREALESALDEQPDKAKLQNTLAFLFAWKTAEPRHHARNALEQALHGAVADHQEVREQLISGLRNRMFTGRNYVMKQGDSMNIGGVTVDIVARKGDVIRPGFKPLLGHYGLIRPTRGPQESAGFFGP